LTFTIMRFIKSVIRIIKDKLSAITIYLDYINDVNNFVFYKELKSYCKKVP